MKRRIIECYVSDEYIKGGGVFIGAAGSHDDVVLRLSFSEMWDGLNKKVIWQNAHGEELTFIYISSDMLSESGTYDVPIPYSAKKYAGTVAMSVMGTIVSGEVETRATLSVSTDFIVLESVYDKDAQEAQNPDANIVEQLQSQINSVLTKTENLGADLSDTKEDISDLSDSISLDIDDLSKMINTHKQDANNPHSITAEQIGAAKQSQLSDVSKVADEAVVKIDNHTSKTDNPHGVTAEQAGAYTKSYVDGKIGEVSASLLGLQTELTEVREKALQNEEALKNVLCEADVKSIIESYLDTGVPL